MMKDARCCPVCCGRGAVRNGFYDVTGATWVASTVSTEVCRSCNGSGYVVVDVELECKHVTIKPKDGISTTAGISDRCLKCGSTVIGA